jgi:hypothetical protein
MRKARIGLAEQPIGREGRGEKPYKFDEAAEAQTKLFLKMIIWGFYGEKRILNVFHGYSGYGRFRRVR